jgi:putative endonuclease
MIRRLYSALAARLTGSLRPGRCGEAVAARFLKHQRYRILARNLRNRFGELDLVAEAPDRKTIVIVEVKSGGHAVHAPEIRVDRDKQRRLIALAAQLARAYRLQHRPFRFDVIAVDQPDSKQPVIRHHVGAFQSHV